MRLTDAQVHQIIQALRSFMHNGLVELRLYGSRLDDHAKDGDIDLLLLVEQVDFADNLMELKPVMLAGLRRALGDQKINLKISAKEDVAGDTYLKTLVSKSLILYRFG